MQQVAKRASKAAAPLAAWVKANLRYAAVLEKIGPLETESLALEASLAASQEKLQKLTADLATIDGECARLRANFQQGSDFFVS